MAIVIYNNGIVEEDSPSEFVYTDEELISFFEDYPYINSHRIIDVPNGWIIWGVPAENIDIEYNRIGEELTGDLVYSPILIIHDTELNLEWGVTDDIIRTSYKDFKNEIYKILDNISKEILEENHNNIASSNKEEMIFLTSKGTTDDKRVLFAFDHTEQSDEFYSSAAFEKFSEKALEYVNTSITESKPINPFIIFADDKSIVMVDDLNVNGFLGKLIDVYTNKERYDICAKVLKIKTLWDECTGLKPQSTDIVDIIDDPSTYNNYDTSE